MIKEILKRWLRNVPLTGNVIKLRYVAANKQEIALCAVRLAQFDHAPITTLALNPNELVEAIDRTNLYTPAPTNKTLGARECRDLTVISTLKNKKPTVRHLITITVLDPAIPNGRKYLTMSLTQFTKCATRWENVKSNFANRSATLLETVALCLKKWLKIEF